LGVLGTGHIAAVIIRRLLECGYLSGDRIIVTKSRKLSEHPLDVVIADNAADVVRDARMVMISVTPQRVSEAAESIREAVNGDHLFLSLMAGVSTQRVAATLGGPVRVIRAMPNLPFGHGRGVTGLFKGAHATRDDLEEAKHFFNAGGVSV